VHRESTEGIWYRQTLITTCNDIGDINNSPAPFSGPSSRWIMCALLISGKREQTPISLLHLIPFYLPIVATASLERADAGSRSSIVQARHTPRSRSSDISIPVREIRYLYLRININKRLARAVLTLIHTARSRTLSVYCLLRYQRSIFMEYYECPALWSYIGCFSLSYFLLRNSLHLKRKCS